MRQRLTRLILAGTATCAVGLGATALDHHETSSPQASVPEVTLPAVDHVAAVTDLAPREQAPPRLTSPMAMKMAVKAAAKAERAAQKSAPGVKTASRAKADLPVVLLQNQTLGSYFWDTGGSGNGDTGAPASGTPMREGCFASPSWPMGTKGYIEYHGKRAAFTICDRGPGTPSRVGVMIDIDGITYAKLTGGRWSEPYVIGGDGLHGNIPITYCVTQWGEGPGKGAPRPL
ncbi:hypothetical protein ACRYCC_43305 [Actinomadura scrupuli]|uniref:hypothetical protein n=1 Tax=Actinomadura scrupuli TaxID=559629 RepID=UPI003D9686F7